MLLKLQKCANVKFFDDKDTNLQEKYIFKTFLRMTENREKSRRLVFAPFYDVQAVLKGR